MDTFFQRRINKIQDQINELQSEVELVHQRSRYILERAECLGRNVTSLDELSLLEKYSSIYGFVSKYTKVLSDFNCNLEMLLYTDGLMTDAEHAFEAVDQAEEDLNADDVYGKMKPKKPRTCGNFPGAMQTSPREKLGGPAAGTKENGRVTEGEDAEENSLAVQVPKGSNSSDKSRNSGECPREETKDDGVLDAAKLLGCPVRKAAGLSGSKRPPAIKSESATANDCSCPPSPASGVVLSDSNYLHVLAAGDLPAEGGLWQAPAEAQNHLQGAFFGSGQLQMGSFNHYRSTRQNFYFPPIQSPQNFNIWNKEYYYSNFQTWNSPSNHQIVANSSMQYVYPFQPGRNYRYDFLEGSIPCREPSHAAGHVRGAQHSAEVVKTASSVSVGKSHSSPPPTSRAVKVESVSANVSYGTAEEAEGGEAYPEGKVSLTDAPGREIHAKSIHGIRLLSFSREIGSKHNVKITHFDSPKEFYVHVDCEELALLNIMNKQLARLDLPTEAAEPGDKLSCHDRKVDFLKKFGRYALTFCPDNSSWNRLKVLDWLWNCEDDTVRALLVDHGRVVDLPLSRMRPMDSIYGNYPRFAQKCHLSGLSNPGVRFKEIRAVFEILMESVDESCNLMIEIVEVDDETKEDVSLGVRLFLPDLDVCVNEKISLVCENEDFEANPDAMDKAADDLGSREISSSDESVPNLGTFLPQFSVGDKVNVKITCILRVNRFFCVKDYEGVKEVDVLANLAYCLNSEEKTYLDAPPRVGELILGKYSDNLYYRAKVIKAEPNTEKYKVLFLDYGNTEKVSLKDMRKMEKKHLKIPFQMIECHLDCMELRTETRGPLEAINYFTRKIGEGPLTVDIKRILDSKRGVYSVDIYDGYGNSISNDLISHEYCVSFKKS